MYKYIYISIYLSIYLIIYLFDQDNDSGKLLQLVLCWRSEVLVYKQKEWNKKWHGPLWCSTGWWLVRLPLRKMTFKRIWQPIAACFLVFFTLLHHQTVAMQIVATVAQGTTKEPQQNDHGRGQNEWWTALTLSVLGDWGSKNMSLTPICYVHVYWNKTHHLVAMKCLKTKNVPGQCFSGIRAPVIIG